MAVDPIPSAHSIGDTGHVSDHNLIVTALGDLQTKVPISSQSGSYTFALTDAGTEVECSSTSAVNFTVPPNSSVAFPVGTVLTLRAYGVPGTGAGVITVVPGSGVTVYSSNGLRTRAQYSTASLIQRAANIWILSGDTQV